jgi:hypothetical protein
METCAAPPWKFVALVLATVGNLSGAVSNLASVGEKVVGRALMLLSPLCCAALLDFVRIPCRSDDEGDWCGGECGANTGWSVTSGYGGGLLAAVAAGTGSCRCSVWLNFANCTNTSLKLIPPLEPPEFVLPPGSGVV